MIYLLGLAILSLTGVGFLHSHRLEVLREELRALGLRVAELEGVDEEVVSDGLD